MCSVFLHSRNVMHFSAIRATDTRRHCDATLAISARAAGTNTSTNASHVTEHVTRRPVTSALILMIATGEGSFNVVAKRYRLFFMGEF